MNSKLFKGLDEGEVGDLKSSFGAATLFRKQLKAVLEDHSTNLLNSMLNDTVLTSPNWALVHADRLAQLKCNDRLLKLIK
jgi:hypothetical protein